MSDLTETHAACPFCGRHNLDFVDGPAGNKTFFAVMCVTCGAQGPDCVCIDDMGDAWNRRGTVSKDDLSRWRAQHPERIVAGFAKVLAAAEARIRSVTSDTIRALTERNKYLLGEIDSLRIDPWRIPEEAVPRGWSFDTLRYDQFEPAAHQWCCVLRDGYCYKWTGYGSSPRAAVLNAISSRGRT